MDNISNDFLTSGFFSDNDNNNIEDIFSGVEKLPSVGGMCQIGKFLWRGKWHIIKRLKPEYANNPLYISTLENEFTIGYKLDHPNIVRYLHKGSDSKGIFLILEYADAITLREAITLKSPDRKTIDRIIIQLLDTLDYLHSMQVYHLDLKPENILITKRGNNIKLIDFGLSITDSHLGISAGTNRYAAPEQKKEEFKTTVGPKSDLYSFGLIVLELFTGTLNIKNVSKLPSRYRSIVKRCLNESSNLRPPAITDIINFIKAKKTLGYIYRFLLIACIILLGFALFKTYQFGKQWWNNHKKQADGLSKGLIAYYPFNGNANDESGNGHNGIVNGAILTKDRFGNPDKAYRFDKKSGGNINCGVWNMPNQITFSGFFRLRENSSNDFQFVILSKFDDFTGSKRTFMVNVGSKDKINYFIAAYISPDGGLPKTDLYLTGINPVFFNQWYHVAITYDGVNELRIYLNGSLDVEKDDITFSQLYNSSTPVIIGEYYPRWDNGTFNGELDEIRIYNRVLTEPEISSLYHEGGWSTTNPAPINYSENKILTTGLCVPNQLVADTMGYLFVNNHSFAAWNGEFTNSIAKVDTNGNKSVFIKGYKWPSGIAIDKKQNIYFTQTNASYCITKITSSGKTKTFANLPHFPGPITLFDNGNPLDFAIYTVSHFGKKGIIKTNSDGTYSVFDGGSYGGCQVSNDGQFLYVPGYGSCKYLFRFNTNNGKKDTIITILKDYSFWAGTIGPDNRFYFIARSISDTSKKAIYRFNGYNDVAEIVNKMPYNNEFNDLVFVKKITGKYDLYVTEVVNSNRTAADANRIIKFKNILTPEDLKITAK